MERTCAAGRCNAGACVEACDLDDKGVVGCEFLAAKLDHMSPGDRLPFAVTVSNVGTGAVTVSVVRGDGTEVASRSVAGGQLETIELPRQDVIASSRSFNSFRVVSDGPVTVHQFNPVARDGIASTDASLLLPTTSLGIEHVVIGWPSVRSGRVSDGRTYVTVIAAEDETEVTIAPAVATVAGEGVPAIAAGTGHRVTLSRGEVFSVGTANTHGLDLTGTRVTSSRPVAVFFGSKCADVPLGTCCCDHIEQQMVPVETWGTTVVAPKFRPRGSEVDIWRIVAARDDTEVTLTPPVGGLSAFTLRAGEVRQVESSSSFLIEANGPIMAGQFMIGASGRNVGGGCGLSGGLGDPAYSVNVGTAQYLTDYQVLIPQGFRDHYLSLVLPQGASATVNGAPASGPVYPVTGTGWSVQHVTVQPGVLRVEASAPIGLYAYGYDCAVSYAYPGGMNLDAR